MMSSSQAPECISQGDPTNHPVEDRAWTPALPLRSHMKDLPSESSLSRTESPFGFLTATLTSRKVQYRNCHRKESPNWCTQDFDLQLVHKKRLFLFQPSITQIVSMTCTGEENVLRGERNNRAEILQQLDLRKKSSSLIQKWVQNRGYPIFIHFRLSELQTLIWVHDRAQHAAILK